MGFEAGDTLTFGHYPQGTDPSVKDPIAWSVLEVRTDRILLISTYGLDVRPFDTQRRDVLWLTCSLRRWLHFEFMESAFSEEERSRILRVRNRNPGFDGFCETKGYGSTDWVFPLNTYEAYRYFPGRQDRRVKPTAYCISRGAATEDGFCWWWLRKKGASSKSSSGIRPDGSSEALIRIDLDFVAVRPALWLRL